MDQFYLMHIFVAVAEQGSFAGAARLLGISISTQPELPLFLGSFEATNMIDAPERVRMRTLQGRSAEPELHAMLPFFLLPKEPVVDVGCRRHSP